ncbi:E2F/DP family winged-helix DNA-binding domain-containing protein [Dichotomocladium elegans]|nr:E2F/DP family winged-helix DNA-binding domain-containing protein [Dichotomocladium elegans]
MAPSTTTTSAFLPWIMQPQAVHPNTSISSIRRHFKRSLSDGDTARLPPLFGEPVASSPPLQNARRNSFPDTGLFISAIDGRISRDSDDEYCTEDSLIALRPIIQTHSRSQVDHPSYQEQLPPIQHITVDEQYQAQCPSSLSSTSRSSRCNSLSSWSPTTFDSLSRKGSIASLLNSDSESRPPPSANGGHDVQPMALQTPALVRRGRPRVTKRKRNGGNHEDEHDDDETEQKRRTTATKGLRHFSKLVSDKVAERGVTTYNQVADELAADMKSNSQNADGTPNGVDQKNIRRRVYDALNVLMAMGIIAKDKKEIRWLGIPPSFNRSQDRQQQQKQEQVEAEIKEEEMRYQLLTEQIQEVHLAITHRLNEYLRLGDLINRNEKQPVTHEQRVRLPFSIVRCNQDDVVDVAADGRHAVIVSNNSAYNDNASTVHADFDILESLGFAACQRSYLPDSSWYPFLCPPRSGTIHVGAS